MFIEEINISETESEFLYITLPCIECDTECLCFDYEDHSYYVCPECGATFSVSREILDD